MQPDPATNNPATNNLVGVTAVADGVLRLTLNRPEALNALNRDLTAALERALERVAAMEDVRVLLVCGEGRAFCAGNDIKEMETITGDEAQALATRHAVLMDRFSRLPQVTLAVIDGHALGGGHGRDLLLSGRVVHASEALRLGLVNRVVAAPTLEASATKWAAEIASSPREGLAATKQIVAAIRDGTAGREPEAYGAALRTSAAARARIRAFTTRTPR